MSIKDLIEHSSKRRSFLKAFAVGAAAAIVPSVSLSSRAASQTQVSPPDRIRRNDMIYRRLGRTGLFISEISLGGSPLPDERLLFQLIEEGMVGHDEVGASADEQARGVDTLAGKLVQFLDQDSRRDNHAVANDAGRVGVEDACGNQVQCELAMRVVDGVTGIRPAGETDHHTGFLSEQVNDLALSFVTPLDSDNDSYRHRTSHVSRRPGPRAGIRHIGALLTPNNSRTRLLQ